MEKLKKGDTIVVLKGKDKGKKGRVLAVFVEKNRILVEGINLVKKHKRQTRQEEKGGIVSVETPISRSNLALYCKQCDRGVRVGFSILKDGTKARLCKSCKEVI